MASPTGMSALDQGKALFAAKKYKEALSAFEQFVTTFPDNASGWAHKSEALAAMERYDEGLRAAQEALRLDQEMAFAWTEKAENLCYLKRYQEGLVAANRAIELDRNSPAWNTRGYALYYLGKYETAVLSFDEHLRLYPDSASSAVSKAWCLMKLSRHLEAVSAFKRTLELRPNDESAKNGLRDAQIFAYGKEGAKWLGGILAGVLLSKGIDQITREGSDDGKA